jgi:hypothetical protein
MQVFDQPAEADVRGMVLAGPGGDVRAVAGDVLPGLVDARAVGAALARAAHTDARRRDLGGGVCAVLVLGLCLFSHESYSPVLQRLWPFLGRLNPALALRDPVSAAALSQARGQLPVAVMRNLFEVAAAVNGPEPGVGQRRFGLLLSAVDGTVFDLAATDAMRARFATPTGGRFPQARVVTLIACGTRRILGAVMDSSAVSEQALWDRLVTQLQPGTLNLADRNFFSMNRWRIAAGTGAHLLWRVKNGRQVLPATVTETLSDGSYLVRLRESDAMLAARRKATRDTETPRLQDITARMVEFMVTVTDQAGHVSFSRFRILSTLLDPDLYPAGDLAACYAERWHAETAYKTIKSTLRGPRRRMRGQSPDLAEQEIWGLLTIYNAVIDHAVTAAVDLGLDPDQISFTTVLRAVRDHLTPARTCGNCGQHTAPTAADLTAAITNGPKNPTRAPRTSPRTARDRKTQKTRKVTYTITISKANLPRAT